MSGRVPYTRDEERLLVKYIATYNPQVKGRAGNALYKTLCENTNNKWKWSRTHTWQSWRDRYYKNSEFYNREIRKYQKKHNISVDGPVDETGEDESAGETHSTQTKRKREDEKEEKRTRLKRDPGPSQGPKTPRITEAETVTKRNGKSPTSDADRREPQGHALGKNHVDTHTRMRDQLGATAPGAPVRSKLAPPSIHPKVENPASSVRPTIPITTQKPPVSERSRVPSTTYQTPRRTIRADPQPVASSSKVQLSSPHSKPQAPSPRRRKPAIEEDVFFASSPSATASQTSPSDTVRFRHRMPKLVEGAYGTHFVTRRKSGVESDDSSNREEGTKAKAWPPIRRRNVSPKLKAKSVERSANSTAANSPSVDQQNGHGHPRAMRASSVEMEGQGDQGAKGSLQSDRDRAEHSSRPVGPYKPNGRPVGQLPLLRHSSAVTQSTPGAASTSKPGHNVNPKPSKLIPRNSWTPGDPFRSENDTSTLARRHSIGNLQELQNSTVRRLDLRAELAKRRFAASSPFARSRRGRSIATTISYQPSPSTSHAHAPSPKPIDNIERRHSSIPIADEDRERIEFLGLTAAIEGLANASGIPKERLWQVYNHYGSVRRTEEWVSVLADVLTSEKDALAHAGEAHDRALISEKSNRGPTTTNSTNTRPSPLKTQEKRLKLKPLPPGSERPPSEYSPPPETRAGEWNRLVEQGRAEEAIAREHRRVSGSGAVFPRLRSSPITWNTPNSSVTNATNGTGPAETNEIGEDDEEVVEQLLDGSDEAETSGELREEEQMMLLDAHAGSADELREIEQRMGPDYMLQWVTARFREIAAAKSEPSP
ncbi:hypothetical protein DXG01_001178 [Tephrocybe rancida]|nr:hypothetical protein DXG01_001178 [Tephrocybe rancida]